MRTPRTMMKARRLVAILEAIIGSGLSAAHCNINSARFVPGPAIPLQRVVDAMDGRYGGGVPVEDAIDDFDDRGKGKFSGQEPLHCDFIRRVEHGGHRAAGPA